MASFTTAWSKAIFSIGAFPQLAPQTYLRKIRRQGDFCHEHLVM
jgi:hypothetical protein